MPHYSLHNTVAQIDTAYVDNKTSTQQQLNHSVQLYSHNKTSGSRPSHGKMRNAVWRVWKLVTQQRLSFTRCLFLSLATALRISSPRKRHSTVR
eukprot:5659347-Pleurochrysis_carterae.AAC.2